MVLVSGKHRRPDDSLVMRSTRIHIERKSVSRMEQTMGLHVDLSNKGIRGDNPMKHILILTLLFSINALSQVTIEKFLNEPFDNTVASIREKNRDKKIEEQDVMIYTGLMYYDWLEPISVRVGYLFSKDGNQKGKVLANGKGIEEDAQTFFNLSKAALIKKFGADYAESSMLGTTTFAWNHVDGYSIMLTRKKLKTTLTMFSK